ncbi:SAM-dependent methyltransferase [Candidatus Sulfotelmatobacter kueseliae]|uniref:SAM-dependent methyltransferase n=1 Tax=Candidatus Sulfotelmatobacter kueseliae TaxID=2042962 RepID=A0A2U3KWT3_9BACT|nr:SAM-dependent methyltransferase [Candidatus Sulfotelmatobacter kueseliae]
MGSIPDPLEDQKAQPQIIKLVTQPAIQTDPCPVCSSQLFPYFHGITDSVTGRQFDVLKCEGCGVGVTHPFPEQLQPHYDGYYGSRHGITANYRAKRRIALVTKMAGMGQGRHLLDVGCGEGTFLQAARDRGWQAVGTELNPDPARRLGFDVFNSLEECADLGPFSCVTLWHSLEHMTDPRAAITKVRRLVADDGVVFIAVPDFEGFQSKTFGESWLHLDVPRHLYHFTATALDRVLNQTEFTPVAHWHQEFEYDLIGWLQSALNKVLPTPNVLFDFLSRKKLRGTLMDRVVSGIAMPIFSFVSLPLVWLGAFARSGGTLLVAARTSGQRLASGTGD